MFCCGNYGGLSLLYVWCILCFSPTLSIELIYCSKKCRIQTLYVCDGGVGLRFVWMLNEKVTSTLSHYFRNIKTLSHVSLRCFWASLFLSSCSYVRSKYFEMPNFFIGKTKVSLNIWPKVYTKPSPERVNCMRVCEGRHFAALLLCAAIISASNFRVLCGGGGGTWPLSGWRPGVTARLLNANAFNEERRPDHFWHANWGRTKCTKSYEPSMRDKWPIMRVKYQA